MVKHYFQTAEEVLHSQGSGQNGLSEKAAAEALQKHGENKLDEGKKKSLPVRVWDQIKDPMVLVLIAAAIVSSFHDMADTIIILIVVTLNAVLGIVQESKAEKAIEALQKMSASQTRVRRNGTVCQIKSHEVVPGDIVLLEAGDSVPADLRLIESNSLKIEEAALTGESVPVDKESAALEVIDAEVPLGDRINMAYMGTNVVYGRGEGVVTATGMSTEMGKIAGILSSTEEEKTPLQQKLSTLSKVLSIAVLGICVFIFAFDIIRGGIFSNENIDKGNLLLEALISAVALAVAAIPEGLVVVVTVLLSIGVTKMSKKSAIIRRMTAVETLGCTQVICSDKTGTLTQNKMTVTDAFGQTELLAQAMFLCNDTKADASGGYLGDPTEVALYEYALKQKSAEELLLPRVGEAPFDSVRKMMSTLHEKDGRYIQYTKGAPDEILKCCTSICINGQIEDMTDEHRQKILTENKAMADKALRVLAAACAKYDSMPGDTSPEQIEKELTFIGLTGMIDPVRPEVKDAIAECRSAGISAVMITGDHRDTAVAIAKELGLLTEGKEAMTGAELSELSDEEFEKRISNIAVYARVQPEHKVRIVNMWRKKGRITAMTGDGVNDAPALKSADIGVGMGITGTDVTKNVADMVLADDNFATIVYAVEEGRRIYENIRKAIQFLLASNLSEVVSIFIATLASQKIFLPIHILWINLVTDTFPAMALGMEPAEPDAMSKPPRKASENIFSNGLGSQVVFQGVVIALLTLASFFIGHRLDPVVEIHDKAEIGMTMAFLTLSACEVFHALNMRSRSKSIFSLKLQNMWLWGAMGLSFVLTLVVMYLPGLNDMFKLVPLNAKYFFTALGLAFLIIPIVEIEKLIHRLTDKKQ